MKRVGEIRFFEIGTSLMIGSFIMYGGFLLNKFFAIIVANKIGKGLWIGLATVITFFIVSFYITKFIGEPEEFGIMTDLLIYQAIVAILTTVILEQHLKNKEKVKDMN